MQWLLTTDISLAYAASVSLIVGGVFLLFTYAWQNQKWQGKMSLLQHELDNQTNKSQQAQSELDELDVELDKASMELRQTHGDLMAAQEKLRHFEPLKTQVTHYQNEVSELKNHIAELIAQSREIEAKHLAEANANLDKLELLKNAESILKQQFEQIANQLFEVKTAKVDQQNKQSLDAILSPLKEQIEGFKKQVGDSFSTEAKERHTLTHEIKSLQKLNQDMAKEAMNLTQALKGDNKQQGNWGEVVLARVLAESGLREGHEYETQVSLKNEEGQRFQPDVIVHLPLEKQVIIDAKMTLVAYERYFNSNDYEVKQQSLNEHLISVRSHIKGLSRKDYHQLQNIRSLDYVLMFIPVEPAFQLAIEADPSLVKDAFEQNIIIVSPTTLLVALRTIDNLWRNDRQNQSAALIADKASKMYDKLRLFVDDMESLGQSIDKAKNSYQGAMNKLHSGRGNLVRQAEGLKEMGVEIKRPISSKVTENALNETLDERQSLEDKVN